MPAPPALLFADLDGTLLDACTYSSAPLVPALATLRRRGMRLVVCTSKTAREVRWIASELGLEAPAVVEAGAAVAWSFDEGAAVETLSVDYATVRSALRTIRAAIGLPLVGFGDVDAAEVARRCGFSEAEAARAQERVADEPFWSERPLEPEELSRIVAEAEARALAVSRGGRFFHLHGPVDKGTGARRVLAALGGSPPTAAFGDAAIDAPLLQSVGVRFAIRRPDGTVDPTLMALPGVRVPRSPGPAGAAEGIAALLREWADRLPAVAG